MSQRINKVLSSHKTILKQGIELAEDLLKHPNMLFSPRLELLTKLITHLERHTKILNVSLIGIKLKHFHNKILQFVGSLHYWPVESIEEGREILRFIKYQIEKWQNEAGGPDRARGEAMAMASDVKLSNLGARHSRIHTIANHICFTSPLILMEQLRTAKKVCFPFDEMTKVRCQLVPSVVDNVISCAEQLESDYPFIKPHLKRLYELPGDHPDPRHYKDYLSEIFTTLSQIETELHTSINKTPYV